jgi:photoactive yellow protein
MYSPTTIAVLDAADIDMLAFGVIGFDAAGYVRVYNKIESQAAGLALGRVIGRHIFESVAPCMNNYLVAQRFEDASREGMELDATIDYVLTLRLKPTPVRMRLLYSPAARYRYILIQRT